MQSVSEDLFKLTHCWWYLKISSPSVIVHKPVTLLTGDKLRLTQQSGEVSDISTRLKMYAVRVMIKVLRQEDIL